MIPINESTDHTHSITYSITRTASHAASHTQQMECEREQNSVIAHMLLIDDVCVML